MLAAAMPSTYSAKVTVTWLVQANMRDQLARHRFEEALDAIGADHHSVDVVPFSPVLPALPFADDGRAIACLGPSFVPRVALSTSWRPGIFFDPTTFRWSVMAHEWTGLMFTHDGAVASARDVLADFEGPLFVRPDEDSKLFDGGVFADAAQLRAAIGANLDVPVVRGAPAPVDAEWRCFVVNGRVVDASEYRRAGQPSLHRGAPPRVLDLVEAAAARWLPAQVTCIDIASSGDRFGIVEANCFSAARFYAADAETILRAVHEA